jgi:hypothetical protein
MSDTLLREKNQITIPGDIVRAAGLSPSDRIAWRFEHGEIHARAKGGAGAGVRATVSVGGGFHHRDVVFRLRSELRGNGIRLTGGSSPGTIVREYFDTPSWYSRAANPGSRKKLAPPSLNALTR